jgi:hypothetical protein
MDAVKQYLVIDPCVQRSDELVTSVRRMQCRGWFQASASDARAKLAREGVQCAVPGCRQALTPERLGNLGARDLRSSAHYEIAEKLTPLPARKPGGTYSSSWPLEIDGAGEVYSTSPTPRILQGHGKHPSRSRS